MRPFFMTCLETAMRETRVVTLPTEMRGIPAGTYVFHELYCADLACDCRRVTIFICHAEDEEMSDPLAVLSYGWETEAFYRNWSSATDPRYIRDLASVSINPIYPGAAYKDSLRDLFQVTIDEDEAYRNRFARHYDEFRAAIAMGKGGPASGIRRQVRLGGRRSKRR